MTIILVITSSFIFTFVGVFAGPPSIYSLGIVNTGSLINPSELLGRNFVPYWSSALQFEHDYPAPSLILTILSLVSNVPVSLLSFMPAPFFLSILLYTSLQRLLLDKGINRSLAKFISSLFFFFFAVDSIAAMYIGRATLGNLLFLTVLCIIITRLGSIKREDGIILLIFAVIMVYTYYTGSLLLMIVIVLLALINIISLTFQRPVKDLRTMLTVSYPIFFICLFGILKPTLINATNTLSLDIVFKNIVTIIKTFLSNEKIVISPATFIVQQDPLVKSLKMMTRALKAASILVTILFVIYSIIKRGKDVLNDKVWIFAMFLLLSDGISSLIYSALTKPCIIMSNSLRLGLFVLSYIVALIITKPSDVFKKQIGAFALVTLFAILVIVGALGDITYYYRYGSAAAKPLGFYEVEHVTKFIVLQESYFGPRFIGGDAWYSTFILLKTYEKMRNPLRVSLFFIPLRESIIMIYNSVHLNAFEQIPCILSSGCRYHGLLFSVSKEIIWGDGWGYVVEFNKEYLYSILTKSGADVMYFGSFILIYYP